MLEEQGWYCEKVEHWNAFARIRQDLFGFVDLICLRPGQIMGVQVTSRDNTSARHQKILSSHLLSTVLNSGMMIHIHGWGKLKKGWDCKVIEIRSEE